MWWIAVLVASVAIIAISVIVIVHYGRERGDYNDGGGKQVGGNRHVSIFEDNASKAGAKGEKYINTHLRLLLRSDEYLLGNLLVPLRNGFKVEIDSVLVSRKGVFVIESKYWSNIVKGNDEDEYWSQKYLDDRDEKLHKNPVKQNDKHCDAVSYVLNHKYPIDNIVIIVGLTTSRFIDSQCAFMMDEFETHYRNLNNDELTIEEVDEIYNILKSYLASDEELKQHQLDVQRRHQSK